MKAKWKPEFVELVRKMAEAGSSNDEIAEALGVHTHTFEHWVAHKPELRAAFREFRPAPLKWDPKFVEIAGKMAEAGAIDLEIIAAIGCDLSTFYSWKHKHPEFAAVLRVGKQGPDETVKRSLFMRARGFHYDSEKIFYNHKTGEVVRVPFKEYVPPETLAGIFWSKNRMPDEFRDVKAVEHSGLIRQVHSTEEMSDQRIRDELRATEAALKEAGAAGGTGSTGDGEKKPSRIH